MYSGNLCICWGSSAVVLLCGCALQCVFQQTYQQLLSVVVGVCSMIHACFTERRGVSGAAAVALVPPRAVRRACCVAPADRRILFPVGCVCLSWHSRSPASAGRWSCIQRMLGVPERACTLFAASPMRQPCFAMLCSVTRSSAQGIRGLCNSPGPYAVLHEERHGCPSQQCRLAGSWGSKRGLSCVWCGESGYYCLDGVDSSPQIVGIPALDS